MLGEADLTIAFYDGAISFYGFGQSQIINTLMVINYV